MNSQVSSYRLVTTQIVESVRADYANFTCTYTIALDRQVVALLLLQFCCDF